MTNILWMIHHIPVRKDGLNLMKLWISSFIKNPKTAWFARVVYYYLILMGLFVLYFVQKQHTPPPFIYDGF
ncbi:teichoic acid D-Ala incorporation-associated protein DltX [Desulfosporosinus sp. SB140]|uniref:teichoic acid D-Ala incorporation-associated protein DltX n=1 Tax=Desulfosporosinus paludis TaxID=3115649 RepID=UPI003890796A